METRGMTLLEIIFAVAILTVVMGLIFGLSISMSDAANERHLKALTQDEVRKAMTLIVRDLHQAARATMSDLPDPGMPGISYQIATDLDGNGTAVDSSGNLELSDTRTISRDDNDVNGDGVTNQLVLDDGNGTFQVLANNLIPDEDLNNNATLDPGEDTNFNGRLDRGVWFERVGNNIQVTVQTQARTRSKGPAGGHFMTSAMVEIVSPRN